MSLLGGVLIGISATLLMALHGRIAGMTGILAGLIPPMSTDWNWRFAFLIGAIAAPFAFTQFGGTVPFSVPGTTAALAIGGVIVGVGVFFGSGCTSGHGVCGMARLSPRSIVATLIFMAATFVTVFTTRHILDL